ncbi:MAG TPA: tetratricopeptide repeat protein, partial [Bryobacteraceae bacterium]|nr:tetratricopeptide repeat protein [Bryobacteraceae bacterium]
RIPGTWFDDRNERRRVAYNSILSWLSNGSEEQKQRAIKRLDKLVEQNYVPALWLSGRLSLLGQRVPKNPEKAITLFQRAAQKNHGPALYEIGRLHLAGDLLPKDEQKGWGLIRHAVLLGSPAAQFYLAAAHEFGEGVPKDLERSRQLYEMCADSGFELCQYRLGRLLLETKDGADHHYLQGLAWLSLASEGGVADARRLAETERARLRPEQMEWVEKLKKRLSHRVP